MHKKTLADIKHKLSIISKHSQSMHNELRYQAKMHTTSAKLLKRKNKILHLLPQLFFNYYEIQKKKHTHTHTQKQQKHALRKRTKK
jgi:hypothetical protein